MARFAGGGCLRDGARFDARRRGVQRSAGGGVYRDRGVPEEHNDSIDDERRQDLYVYAAKVVGSRPRAGAGRAGGSTSEWDSGVRQRQSPQSNVPWPRRALNRMLNAMFEEIPSYALYGLTVHNDETHAEVLALVDELLAIKPGCGGHSAASVEQKPAAGPSRRQPSRTAQ